jgi:urease accessory protein
VGADGAAASSALLLLADGRFPAGSHAHSGGLEEAIAAGRVRHDEDLLAFLAGRLATTGRVDAALAAAAWTAAPSIERLLALDAEAVARCPSPAQREASRAQGRGLLRAAKSIWPASTRGEAAPWPGLAEGLPHGPMYPVALGAVGRHAGLSLTEAALAAAQASVSGPAWAATRLLGVSPFAVGHCLARLSGAVETVASLASGLAAPGDVVPRLPAYSAPLMEIGAEDHARWEVRLFAS